MPKLVTPIHGTYQTITRPVVKSVLNDMLRISGVSVEEANVIILDSTLKTPKVNTTNTNKSSSFDGSKVYVTVNETMDSDNLRTLNLYRRNEQEFIRDDSIGLSIRPMYISSNVELSVKYSTLSRTDIDDWLVKSRVNLDRYNINNPHDLVFSYNIPDEYGELLTTIHDLTEAQGGIGDDFNTYLAKHTFGTIGLVTTVTGSSNELMVKEKQVKIIGSFDFSPLPDKPDIIEDKGKWEVTFTYKFTYNKPIQVIFEYPLMVHNQLVPNKYINIPVINNELPSTNINRNMDLAQYKVFEDYNYTYIRDMRRVLKTPTFDDWQHNLTTPKLVPIVTCMISIKPTDLRNIVNLRDLGEAVLHSELLDFIASTEYPFITTNGSTIINIKLIRQNKINSGAGLQCDQSLNVFNTVDLDIRGNYHLVIYMVKDLSYLNAASIDRLRNNINVFLLLIRTIKPNLVTNAIYLDVENNNYVSDINLNKLKALLI